MFDQRFLDELIARSDIVDVVSGYVALQRKGGNLFGLCPFHNEKTPSFSVSPDKQIYHCFGCKKGGGVINFIMEIENLTFPEAVRFLAKRANLPVPEDDGPQDGADRLRRRVLELNRDAVQDASGQQYKLVSREEPHAAQISLVMGSDHDRWQDNLRLAVAVEERLMQSYPTLMRPITLRNYSYNQSVCPGSMLVEVGAAGNSLDEAIYAARLFAAGLAETITA